MQDVEIVVRLDSHRGDPLKRHIVPLCHDKAFFCSSRVPPLTEWRVTRNLDWHVERGARGRARRRRVVPVELEALARERVHVRRARGRVAIRLQVARAEVVGEDAVLRNVVLLNEVQAPGLVGTEDGIKIV